MDLLLPYGSSARQLHLPAGVHCDELAARPYPSLADPAAAVRKALSHPLGSPPLRQSVKPEDRVAILVNDITRLVRSGLLLPPLLDELNQAGIPDSAVFIVFALGLLRKQTAEEQLRIVGEEVARRVAMFDHDSQDPDQLVSIGTTSRGNEVLINERVHEADFVILIGEIIPHLIAEYSGGRKSLVPGVAGASTIFFNHPLALDPRCRSGGLDGNPAHEDLSEACRLFDPGFLLNVILNAEGESAHVVAGHYHLAHRAGCELVRQLLTVTLGDPYKVVVASAGGHPFDIDLRQAHKGLENAAGVVQDRGTVIFFAECPDGSGSRPFEEWSERYESAAQMEEALRRDFVVGAHKAYWMARLGERVNLVLISGLPERFVRNCRARPTADPQRELEEALLQSGAKPRVAYIPHAGLTLPAPRAVPAFP